MTSTAPSRRQVSESVTGRATAVSLIRLTDRPFSCSSVMTTPTGLKERASPEIRRLRLIERVDHAPAGAGQQIA